VNGLILIHYVIIFWLSGGALVSWMSGRNMPEAIGWFFYGLMLLPIAMVHVMIMRSRDQRIRCAHCAEPVNAAARICPHCRLEGPAAAS
jgi:hypothetical protein